GARASAWCRARPAYSDRPRSQRLACADKSATDPTKSTARPETMSRGGIGSERVDRSRSPRLPRTGFYALLAGTLEVVPAAILATGDGWRGSALKQPARPGLPRGVGRASSTLGICR